MLRRARGNKLAITPVAKNLERILPDGRGAAPDQDRIIGMRRRGGRHWPGKRKLKISGHSMEYGYEVVPENNCLLGSESHWNLRMVNDGMSLGLNKGCLLLFPEDIREQRRIPERPSPFAHAR